MDGFEIEAEKKWQSKNLSQAKESTLKKIELAEKKKLEYLTILFHDRYFNNSFKTWMDWYCWLVDWLKQNNFQFINYRTAIEKILKIVT
jgi:IS4 transposase